MRNCEKYAGRRVLVVGMARSGVAAAQMLVKAGARVIVNDSKTAEQLGEAIAPLKGLPVEWALGCPAAECLENTDVLVISPGIPDTAGFVLQAKDMGIQVTGELELASQLAQGTLLALTGTNGKTTTVSLLGEIFRLAGKRTHVVGNIGYPFSAAAMDSAPEDIFVCEVSSFQMETAHTFRPKVGALLNITEDHLNRHGTMENYTAVKMRLFARQDDGDTAVFNADDPALLPLMDNVHSRVMTFSRLKEVPLGAFLRDGTVMLRSGGAEETVCAAEEICIPGPHNLENALAAVCMASAMGVPVPVIAQALRTFTGVEHRIEFVRELQGVRYINDSKGTNVDSTVKAIQTMQRPTAIILGGYDKHCDFTPMVKEMVLSPYIQKAILIGATAGQIERTCLENGFDAVLRADSLEQAVSLCREAASDGWNVLLSPACASFDMFEDYEARGRIFKEIVRSLD